MTPLTCPCGKPERGFRYIKDGFDIPACSMRCLDRIVELKGVIPERRVVCHATDTSKP